MLSTASLSFLNAIIKNTFIFYICSSTTHVFTANISSTTQPALSSTQTLYSLYFPQSPLSPSPPPKSTLFSHSNFFHYILVKNILTKM
jgi:hypothetical protein